MVIKVHFKSLLTHLAEFNFVNSRKLVSSSLSSSSPHEEKKPGSSLLPSAGEEAGLGDMRFLTCASIGPVIIYANECK